MTNLARKHPLPALALALFVGFLLAGSMKAILSVLVGLGTSLAFCVGCVYVVAHMLSGSKGTAAVTNFLKSTCLPLARKAATKAKAAL